MIKSISFNTSNAIVVACVFFLTGCSAPVLTVGERDWLEARNKQIVLAADPQYPPIDFLDDNGVQQGIAADYVAQIENNLNFRFKRIYLESWEEIIEAVKKGEVDALSAVKKKPERLDYLLFTAPYLNIDNYHIVREEVSDSLSIEQVEKLRLAYVEGYPQNNLKIHRAFSKKIPVENPVAGLEMVSKGKADTIILNLATASYYIEKHGFTNLKPLLRTTRTNIVSMAARKDIPILASILEKGLATIKVQEKNKIHNKWIKLARSDTGFSEQAIRWMLHAASVVVILFFVFLVWNYQLRRKVKQRTSELRKEIDLLEKKDRQLIQAQKMETIGTLAGGLAHDFNNVLLGILGGLSAIRYSITKRGDISMEKLAHYLDTMELSGERASAVVKQLLAISRRQEISFDAVDINSCVKNVIRICEHTVDGSIKQIIRFYPSNAMCSADASLVEQVILNLCVNASQAMVEMRSHPARPGGTLTVSVDKIVTDEHYREVQPLATSPEYWCVEVGDTGVGIKKDILHKIYDPFFTTKDTGTGLGLAMVYNIVERHGGFIDVNSVVDVGTTIKLHIPTDVNREMSALDRISSTEIFRGQGTILVVDDDNSVCVVARSILESCGYKTLKAADGAEGVSIFKESHLEIKAVLLDMVMPVMSGLEAFNEMQKIDSSVPIIITSGFRQDARVEEAMKNGAREFVQKPYTLDMLAGTLSKVCSSRES